MTWPIATLVRHGCRVVPEGETDSVDVPLMARDVYEIDEARGFPADAVLLLTPVSAEDEDILRQCLAFSRIKKWVDASSRDGDNHPCDARGGGLSDNKVASNTALVKMLRNTEPALMLESICAEIEASVLTFTQRAVFDAAAERAIEALRERFEAEEAVLYDAQCDFPDCNKPRRDRRDGTYYCEDHACPVGGTT